MPQLALVKTGPKMRPPNPVGIRCSHCERLSGNFAGGFARTSDGRPLCHPNVSGRPDCYHLVTLYRHEMPCVKTVCYEDHDDPKAYISGGKRVKSGKSQKA